MVDTGPGEQGTHVEMPTRTIVVSHGRGVYQQCALDLRGMSFPLHAILK